MMMNPKENGSLVADENLAQQQQQDPVSAQDTVVKGEKLIISPAEDSGDTKLDLKSTTGPTDVEEKAANLNNDSSITPKTVPVSNHDVIKVADGLDVVEPSAELDDKDRCGPAVAENSANSCSDGDTKDTETGVVGNPSTTKGENDIAAHPSGQIVSETRQEKPESDVPGEVKVQNAPDPNPEQKTGEEEAAKQETTTLPSAKSEISQERTELISTENSAQGEPKVSDETGENLTWEESDGPLVIAEEETAEESKRKLEEQQKLESDLASLATSSADELAGAFPDFNWDDFEVVDECIEENEVDLPPTDGNIFEAKLNEDVLEGALEIVDEFVAEEETKRSPEQKQSAKSATKPGNRNRIAPPKPSSSKSHRQYGSSHRSSDDYRYKRSNDPDSERYRQAHSSSTKRSSSKTKDTELAKIKNSNSTDKSSGGKPKIRPTKLPTKREVNFKGKSSTTKELKEPKKNAAEKPTKVEENSQEKKKDEPKSAAKIQESEQKRDGEVAPVVNLLTEAKPKPEIKTAEEQKPAEIISKSPGKSEPKKQEKSREKSAEKPTKQDSQDDVLDLGISAEEKLFEETELILSSEESLLEEHVEKKPREKKKMGSQKASPKASEPNSNRAKEEAKLTKPSTKVYQEAPKPQRAPRDDKRWRKSDERKSSDKVEKKGKKESEKSILVDINKEIGSSAKKQTENTPDTKSDRKSGEGKKQTENTPDTKSDRKSGEGKKPDEEKKVVVRKAELTQPLVPKRSEPLPEITAYVDSLSFLEYDVRKYTCFYCNPCHVFVQTTAQWEEHYQALKHKTNVYRWRRCLELASECESVSGKPSVAVSQRTVEKFHDNIVVGASHVVEVCDDGGDPRRWVCVLCTAVCSSVDGLLGHLTSFPHIDNHMERVEPAMYRPPSKDDEIRDFVRQASSKTEQAVTEGARGYWEKRGCGRMRKYVGEKYLEWPDTVAENEEMLEETVITDKMELLFSDDTTEYPLKYKIIPTSRSVANYEYSSMTVDSNNTMIGMQYMLEIWSPSRRVVPVYYCTLCDYLVTNWTLHCTIMKHCAAYLKKHYKTVYECVLLESGTEEEFRKAMLMAKEKVLLMEGRQAKISHVIQLLGHISDVFVAINGQIAKRIVARENMQIPPPPRVKKRIVSSKDESAAPSPKKPRSSDDHTKVVESWGTPGRKLKSETSKEDVRRAGSHHKDSNGVSVRRPVEESKANEVKKDDGVRKLSETKKADSEKRKPCDRHSRGPSQKGESTPNEVSDTEKPRKEAGSESKDMRSAGFDRSKDRGSVGHNSERRHSQGRSHHRSKSRGSGGNTRTPGNESSRNQLSSRAGNDRASHSQVDRPVTPSDPRSPPIHHTRSSPPKRRRDEEPKSERRSDGLPRRKDLSPARKFERRRSPTRPRVPWNAPLEGRLKPRHPEPNRGARIGNPQRRMIVAARPNVPLLGRSPMAQPPLIGPGSAVMPLITGSTPANAQRPTLLHRHEERKIAGSSGTWDRRQGRIPGRPSRESNVGGRRREEPRGGAARMRLSEQLEMTTSGPGSSHQLNREDLKAMEELLKLVDPSLMQEKRNLNHADVEMLRYRMGSETIDALIGEIRGRKNPALAHLQH